MMKTGVKDCRATEGNLGLLVLRRTSKERAQFIMISLWKSIDTIHQFAGDKIDKPVNYPEDKKYLVKLEPKIEHYEIVVNL
jgi:quinol monooxygenase YgiN